MASTTFDIVIIGSGFGGAVMAARLGAWAQANKKTVLVIEKGRDHTGDFDRDTDDSEPLNDQGNRFKHSLDPRVIANVAELHTDTSGGAFKKGAPSMSVVTGKGLGGGSNVYDGVSLRAPTETFEQTRDDRRLWPTLFSRAALNPFYEKVSTRLSVNRLAWTSSSSVPHWQLATMRDFVFADGCSRIGATAVPLKVATKNDANEGWWNQGQRFEGRQSLSKNYLRDAKTSGAVTFQTCSDVESLERLTAPSSSRWLVKGTRTTKGSKVNFEIEARLVVVAAGSIGSTGLLLRSRKNLDALGFGFDRGGLLGKRVSGNGDYGVTGVVGPKYDRAVRGERGKPMSSFCPSFWAKHKFLLIPFHADPLYIALGQPTTFLPPSDNDFLRGGTAVRDGERDWGKPFKSRLTTFSERALTMGCLALDDSEGEIRLNAQGRETVVWPSTHESTELRWKTAVDTMRQIYEALDGEMFLDVYRRDGTVNTAHPLGGCPMTERDTPTRGVVDPCGEVFGCENLFVVDGAIIPSALGVNPSLTIAAVAESIADRLTKGQGTKRLLDRLP
jgi:choline dehydrogenase-like flavoprotein